jgi:putative inorganic carbon (HCO3(-)) transporter
MMTAAMRPRLNWRSAVWIGLALLLGILAARAPVVLFGGGLALAALLVVTLMEPALALVLMLSLAPMKTLIATESPVAFPVDIGQMSFALVVGMWAVWRVTQRRYTPLPRTRLYLPLAVIMLAFVPSLFAALSVPAWVSEFLKWIEIALLVLIVLDLRHRWTWIAFGVVLAAVLQALIGLYEFRGGSGAPHLWIANFRYFRAFGTFGQPNPFSAFMGLTLPLALGLAWGHLSKAYSEWKSHRRDAGDAEKKLGKKLAFSASLRLALVPGLLAGMYAGCALILLAGLLASWGRGAWLGFGAAGIVLVCFAPRRRWIGFLLVVAGSGMFVLLWVAGFVPLSIQQRIESARQDFVGFRDVRAVPISDENFAIIERLAHWQAAIYMADAHPFIGVGLGNYETAYPAYRIPSWPNPLGHAHNDYLNLLAETGLVGLSGYLAGWALIVYWTLQALQQPDPVRRGLALGLLGTWTHLAVHSFVDKLYVNNLFLHIGVMLGLLAAVRYPVVIKHEFIRHHN